MQKTLKKILGLCAFGTILLLIGCGSSSDGDGGSPMPAPAERISFTGVGAHGIFDPSIALDPASSRLWMSYSAVDPSGIWPTNVDVVATRLSYSDDNGKTWIGSNSGALVNDFLDVTIPLASPLDAGTWVNEVSQLIYDHDAIATERWKILWHHYLIINNFRHFEHGWIAMKMASTPEGLASAAEIKLFAGHFYNTGNDVLNGGSRAPVGGPPLIQLNSLAPALNGCAVLTEPGMYASNGELYVSLQCEVFDYDVPPAYLNRLIVLLKCTSSCGNAASWSYLGTVLQKSDASTFGFGSGFAAPSMFASAGSVYLAVTGTNLVTPSVGDPYHKYSGCRVFKFANLETAQLVPVGAQPTLVGSVNGSTGSFNGACAYHAAANMSGMLFSEINTSATDAFQMFMSHTNF